MIAARAPSETISWTASARSLVVVELVADELLGLDDVGRDDVGLGAHRMAQRVAVGVDDGRHVELANLAHELRVEARARRRVLVADEYQRAARLLLQDAGLGHELRQ